jgi:hypothetical protein
VATEWPEFKEEKANDLIAAMLKPIVIDQNRYLAATLGNDLRIQYAAVGYISRKGA